MVLMLLTKGSHNHITALMLRRPSGLGVARVLGDYDLGFGWRVQEP